MRKFLLLIILFTSLSFAGEGLEIDLTSGNTISIDSYKADGETLFIYLPSERGFANGYVPTMQQLAFFDIDVWVLDLHSSYMVPKHRSSIERFDVQDLVKIINIAKNKGFTKMFFITSSRGAQLALKAAYSYQMQNPNSNFIKGHIFHSPHLISGRPDLGQKAEYMDIAKMSNLPIYMLVAQFGTKYFRSDEINKNLEKGGSSVFVHRLRGVRGGFQMRPEADLTKEDLKQKDNLAQIYTQAVKLMDAVVAPKIIKNTKGAKKDKKITFNDPELLPYKGNPNPSKLKLESFLGKKVDLQDYKNQVVLINFWASWCKPCVKEIPSLMRLQAKLQDKPFKIITVNVGEGKELINKFIKKIAFDFPILMDLSGQAVKDWQVYAYPSNFLLDKNGKIRYSYRGALEWDKDDVIDTIKNLL